MTVSNEHAHQLHRTFGALCDEFNKTGFVGESQALLESDQIAAISCWKLFKFLRQKDDCEATRAYCIFAGKILIRLSSLIHSGRIETAEEFKRWMPGYTVID